MSKKIQFNADMKIINAIFAHPEAHTVFRELGIKCVDPKFKDCIEPCVAAEVETLKEGAELHHFDLDELLTYLNALPKIGKKKKAGKKSKRGLLTACIMKPGVSRD